MKRLAQSSFVVAVLAVVACGGDDGDSAGSPDAGDVGGDVDASPDVPDTTAPTLIAVSPEDGATGVAADAVVTITFSEPMDQESVENTFDASDLGSVTMSWNAAGDTLTITPDAPLEYAAGSGDDPSSVDAKRYGVVMGSAAKDLAGNGFGTGFQVQFYTLKEMSTLVARNDALTQSISPSEVVFPDAPVLMVGDFLSDSGAHSTLVFDLSSLPEEATEVTQATIATRQMTGNMQGTPYTDLGAEVLIDHVLFAGLSTENEINGAFSSFQTALASHTGFCVEGQVVIEHEVTADVNDDLANRAERSDRSQFLLRFEGLTDLDGENDYAVISRDLLELQVTYLAP